MIDFKPVKSIQPVESAEIPDSRVGKNRARGAPGMDLPSGKFQFIRGMLVLNGKNITQIIEQSGTQPAAYWSQLAHDLDRFRKETLNRRARKKNQKKDALDGSDDSADLGRLDALVEAYIGKIMRILKKKYDETTEGVSCTLDEDGQLILNGMNVSAFVHMARSYPNAKARLFLKGLKNRLSHILSNRGRNSSFDHMQEVVKTLFDQIDHEMQTLNREDRLLKE